MSVMRLINDPDNPELVAVGVNDVEFGQFVNMVERLNRDLIDSGYEQYHFEADRVDDCVYITQVEGV